MELYIILLCISIVFLLFKPLFHRSKTLNLPPGPTGLPIIGSIHRLGAHPNQSLSELAEIHGPIMSLRLGSVTVVVLSSPEMAKKILQTHAQSFSDRPIPDAIASMPNLEASLVWGPSDDNRWRKLRGMCSTQLFSAQKLNSLQHLRYQKVEQLIEHIRKHCLSGSQVNIGQVVFATTLNLIFSTMFSMDIVDPEFSTAEEFKELVWKIVESAGKPNLSDYFPVLKRFDLQGVRKHARLPYDRMHEIFDEMIGKRMEARASDPATRNGDFLDVLLDQWEENGSVINRETIKPLIQNLFIAGSETSATTTEWAMAELLRNPEVMQKAREELMNVIGSERTVKESDMDELPYLQAVVKETLRLHPAAPLLLPYKARNDVEICGYTIPKGTHALVNIWAINRDPKYWDHPLTFCPGRFIGSKIDYKDGSYEFIPFGAGRRLCLGLPLATRMVHLMLASMILSFDWKLPQGINPQELDMQEKFGMTLKKAVPLYAIPVMR
ncbi:Cytochrome P450 - like 10 [Theobroma cacao]|nr:Cytochrome P450 - like 10 [Theobroma cacao]